MILSKLKQAYSEAKNSFENLLMKHLITSIFFVLIALSSLASDSLKTRRFSILPVPTLGFTPETRFYFGAVALTTIRLSKDTNTRTSNASVEFNYSLRKQAIFDLDWNLFLPEEKWFSKGLISLRSYPDLYFGSSIRNPNDTGHLYESNRSIAQVHFLRALKPKLFFGPSLRYLGFSQIDTASKILFPELAENRVFGLGLNFIFDTRDNLLNATRGLLIELSATNNRVLNAGSYQRLFLDLRHFRKLKNHILSGRYFAEISSNSEIPFFDLSQLGGDDRVRAYFKGRYRNLNSHSFQVEYKSPNFWRLRIAAFGGVSGIGADLSELRSSKALWNYGIGLRLLADKEENINLRLDYALGSEGLGGFYIAFGESF